MMHHIFIEKTKERAKVGHFTKRRIRDDPKWIQEGLKIKVLGIRRNQRHFVGLVALIPTI
jgi:hypothetical protein